MAIGDRSTMPVPAQDSSLYLVLQQMDMIGCDDDGTEYVICRNSRDANGNGVIEKGERIDAFNSRDAKSNSYRCEKNEAPAIWSYYAGNLRYFGEDKAAEVVTALERELVNGLDPSDTDGSSWINIHGLISIGQLYPELVRDIMPVLGNMLYRGWSKMPSTQSRG